MAQWTTEAMFVAGFWRLAGDEDHGYASKILARLPAEAIEHEVPRKTYEFVARNMIGGDGAPHEDPAFIVKAMAAVAGDDPEKRREFLEIQEAAETYTAQRMGERGKEILQNHTARRTYVAMQVGAQGISDLIAQGKYTEAARYAEEVGVRLLALQKEHPWRRGVRTREEITAELLAAASEVQTGGLAWPWWKVQDVFGFLRPGMVAGITGEPGAGKTTFAGNLFVEWTARDVPVIAFSTEMRTGFLNRAYAARAGVPQFIAEGNLFRVRDRRTLDHIARKWGVEASTARVRCEQYGEQYRAVVEEWKNRPWEVVDISQLTPEALIGHTRILRKRYAGCHVVVIVDHMLNLEYPEKDKAFAYVGGATKEFREFAHEDADGGISGVLLFQPRKVERGKESEAAYNPVNAGAIQGNVKSILDLHGSPYLQYVETEGYGYTEWGTRPCKIDEKGRPVRPKKSAIRELADRVKTDDEHVYFKGDKNRTGGVSPTQVLDFHAPSGRIYDRQHVEADADASLPA